MHAKIDTSKQTQIQHCSGIAWWGKRGDEKRCMKLLQCDAHVPVVATNEP